MPPSSKPTCLISSQQARRVPNFDDLKMLFALWTERKENGKNKKGPLAPRHPRDPLLSMPDNSGPRAIMWSRVFVSWFVS